LSGAKYSPHGRFAPFQSLLDFCTNLGSYVIQGAGR
jgi:hypothetical protein